MTLAPSIVHVIVDADYGERLCSFPPDKATWVADTPTNQPVIRSIWASCTAKRYYGYPSGITSFQVAADKTPEDWLLGVLDSLEDHHSEYSQTPAYSILRVIGTVLTRRVRTQLESYDFVKFDVLPDGFVAHKKTS